jgi:GNAT superfamily N-acetyltransferase
VRPHRLVLLGGGHAHLQVLRDLASAPLTDVHVTLVSPSTELVYSGMVPGLVAGRYRDEECRIPLEPLARRANVEFIVGEAIGLDAITRNVTIARRGGAIAGGGSFRIEDGVAQLSGAATLPDHRRQGVQSALLRVRLTEAAQRGCDIAVVTTEPGSKSQENVQKAGFSLLYARAVLVKAPSSRPPAS